MSVQTECINLFNMIFNNMKGRVNYVYGMKAQSLEQDSHTIHGIDCSGFSRYILARCTAGDLIIPDGSQVQLEWCEKHLRKLDNYKDVAYAREDGSRLFIAFLRVNEHRKIGHVWFVWKGYTRESHGGVGVDDRPWNATSLISCTDCFEIKFGDWTD